MKSQRHRSPRTDACKCVRLKIDGVVIRTDSDVAERMVREGLARYVAKQEYKAQERKDAA